MGFSWVYDEDTGGLELKIDDSKYRPIEIWNYFLNKEQNEIREREIEVKETKNEIELEKFEFYKQYKYEELKLKKKEIEAINDNTKVQKQLIDTVLSSVTYLTQLFNKNLKE